MIPSTYNQYIGLETHKREYKKFTFHPMGINIDSEMAEEYCTNFKFDFNDSVIYNLKAYFKLYIPKYTCGYFNSNINGEFYIGINDFGVTEGIPYLGKLPEQYLRNKIYEILSNNVNNSYYNKVNFKRYVNINFIKIKPSDDIFKHNDKLLSYYKEKEIMNQLKKEYKIKLDKWYEDLKYFNRKLTFLVNNYESRMELIKYIKLHDPKSPIINLLLTDYKLKYYDHNDILILKEDINNPYYWVTKWKDEMITKLKNSKPIFQYELDNVPLNMIINVSDMIPAWIEHNNDMNIYVIQIKFFKSKITRYDHQNKNYFSYFDLNKKKWTSCYRTVLINGDPVCLPY